MRGSVALNRGLALLALFLLVYGAKSTLIGAAGSPLPYSDQWNFEALGLYKPYVDGTLDWARLLAPYNEHRMLFTRLILLGLFELSGGWDPVLAMLVNALLHAGFAVLFTAYILPVVPAGARFLVLACTGLCLLLPLGFENTLMGMNSHFYLLLLLSLGTLVSLARAKAFSPLWFFGLGCLLASEFTVASAGLAAFAAVVPPLLQLALRVRARTLREFSAVALIVVIGLAMVLTVPRDAASLALQAKNPADFISAAIAVASLPLATIAGIVLVHAPIVWLLVHALRSRLPRDRHEWGVIALAAWVGAQILAIAYSRPEMALASRYFDIVVLLLPLDLVALLLAAATLGPVRTPRWLAIYAAGWVFVVVVAISAGAYLSSWRLAQQERSQLDQTLPKVTAFLRDGNLDVLRSAPTWLYPNLNQLGAVLSDPDIRRILPDPVRPPTLGGATDATHLKGRFAGLMTGLKAVLGAGPLWLALGAAIAFAAAHLRAFRPDWAGDRADVRGLNGPVR